MIALEKKESNNKYIFIKLLGEGSFGKAFLVRCENDNVHIIIILFFVDQISYKNN